MQKSAATILTLKIIFADMCPPIQKLSVERLKQPYVYYHSKGLYDFFAMFMKYLMLTEAAFICLKKKK